MTVRVNPSNQHARSFARIYTRPPVNNARAVTWPASRGGSERAIIISSHGNRKQLPKPKAKVSGEFLESEVDDPPHRWVGGWAGGRSARNTPCGIVAGWVGGWPPAHQLIRPPNNPSQHTRAESRGERETLCRLRVSWKLLALIRLKIIRLTTALLVQRWLKWASFYISSGAGWENEYM